MTVDVVHLLRHPAPGAHSMERLFADLRAAMPSDVHVSVAHARFPNAGWLRRLLSSLHARQYRSAVCHITGDAHYLTFFLPRRRIVLTVHDCGGLVSYSGVKRLLYRLLWLQIPVWKARVVTVISDATRCELLRHVRVDEAKLHVIPDCVSDLFQPAEPRPQNHKPVLLQVGTKRNKNLERVARAIRGLQCELRVVGRLTAGQQAALDEHGVSYRNVIDISEGEMVELYAEADAVVFASTFEGFGLPILEAQAVGRPVVTSNIAPMAEVAGEGACLVDPYSSTSIRRGVQRVLEDGAYRDRLIRLGSRNVERFRAPAVAAQYASLYRMIGL